MAYTDTVTYPLDLETFRGDLRRGKPIRVEDWEEILDFDRHSYITRYETIQTQTRDLDFSLVEGSPVAIEPADTMGRVWYDANTAGGQSNWIALSLGTIYSVPDAIPGTPNRIIGLDEVSRTLDKNGGLYCAFLLRRAQALIRIRTVEYATSGGKTTGALSSTGTWTYASAVNTANDWKIVPVTDTGSYVDNHILFPNLIESGDLYQIEIYWRSYSITAEEDGACAGYIVAEPPLANANPR